jgi:hypothetical protein
MSSATLLIRIADVSNHTRGSFLVPTSPHERVSLQRPTTRHPERRQDTAHALMPSADTRRPAASSLHCIPPFFNELRLGSS